MAQLVYPSYQTSAVAFGIMYPGNKTSMFCTGSIIDGCATSWEMTDFAPVPASQPHAHCWYCPYCGRPNYNDKLECVGCAGFRLDDRRER